MRLHQIYLLYTIALFILIIKYLITKISPKSETLLGLISF